VVLHDVVEAAGDEHFRLIGRSSDLVNVVGKRSSLAFLTRQLTTIPGVVDGAYFMRDDDEAAAGVTRLAAVVVAPGLDAARLNQALRSRIDPAFLPRPLVFAEVLPRNATGKVPREALRRLIEARHIAGSGSTGQLQPQPQPQPLQGLPLPIPSDHPAFAGHFPGSPVVPGAVLLDEALFVLAAATGHPHQRLAWVKFLRPVRPGQSLLVRHDVEAGGAIRFDIFTGADKVVTGRLSTAVAS